MVEEDESDGRTTERLSTDGPTADPPGCYVFSLTDDLRPLRHKKGWMMGVGHWANQQDETGEVDLVITATTAVYPRHLLFHFNENGRFVLTIRHGGVELDGEQ